MYICEMGIRAAMAQYLECIKDAPANQALRRAIEAYKETEIPLVPESQILQNGDLRLDLRERRFFIGEQEVFLTIKEMEVLRFFMTRRGEALKHRWIINAIWGPAYTEQHQYLRVYIHQLRGKIGADRILSKPGYGYWMPEVPSDA